MLDPIMYRRAALQAPINWEIHYPKVFENVGFPIHIESFAELGQLIDTMQENRFYDYQNELGGLTKHDFYQVVRICRDLVRFQKLYLPYQEPILPLSTLMSAFCLYKKLLRACPHFKSVLEIGPGCGYLSFFLQDHPHLTDYSQIESCESFYILQNLINIHCFDLEFKELAIPEQPSAYTWAKMPHPTDPKFSPVAQIKEHKVCTHYPCWCLDDVRTKKFQLVTSNANLLEFTPEALDEYLKLIHEVLEGFLVVQCLGAAAFGTPETLICKFHDAGFEILYHQTLTTINMLIAKHGFDWDERVAVVERVYNSNQEGKKIYHPQDFIDSVHVGFT